MIRAALLTENSADTIVDTIYDKDLVGKFDPKLGDPVAVTTLTLKGIITETPAIPFATLTLTLDQHIKLAKLVSRASFVGSKLERLVENVQSKNRDCLKLFKQISTASTCFVQKATKDLPSSRIIAARQQLKSFEEVVFVNQKKVTCWSGYCFKPQSDDETLGDGELALETRAKRLINSSYEQIYACEDRIEDISCQLHRGSALIYEMSIIMEKMQKWKVKFS
jgi:hypothetical protein